MNATKPAITRELTRIPRARFAGAVVSAALAVVLAGSIPDCAAYFGQNKVQYENFQWSVMETNHFDIYFYQGSEELARETGRIAEEACEHISNLLKHTPSDRFPLIVYASHNDFQQTNVTLGLIGEGTGGFTEVFKNRMVIPFNGSYGMLRHVIAHEMTHLFMFDVLYGSLFESVVSRHHLFPVPLWFAEGLAEYVSIGWDNEAAMYMRDAAISEYVYPLDYVGGFMAYKQGQHALNYLADKYGEEKIAEILDALKTSRNLDQALKLTLGHTGRELHEEWEEEVRRDFWPEVEDHEEIEDNARRLTDHEKDGAYLNLLPAVSNDGEYVAYVSDREQYTGIFLMSALDGKVLSRLVKGQRSDEFEAFHVLHNSIAWSPDDRYIAFAAKSGGDDALFVLDVEKRKVVVKKRFGLESMATPHWAPDGKRIAFLGTKNGRSDLYIYYQESGKLEQLMSDRYDDRFPAWSHDGRRIAFASDRGTLDDPIPFGTGNPSKRYDIYVLDLDSGRIQRITSHPGQDYSPCWSHDDMHLAFSSDRTGISNIPVYSFRDGTISQLTDVLGGCFSPTWSADGRRMVFSGFEGGGYDVYMIKDPLEKLKKGPEPDRQKEQEVDVIAQNEARARSLLLERALTPETSDSDRDTGLGVSLKLKTQDEDSDENPLLLAASKPVTLPDFVPESAAQTTDQDSNARPDSLADSSDADYPVRRYELKFSPDWVSGGFHFNSQLGMGGGVQLALSDVLGNHRVYLATDFLYSFEESDLVVQYMYLPKRVDYGFGAYHYKNYYIYDSAFIKEAIENDYYYSERNFGLYALLSYPIDRYHRLDLVFLAQQTRWRLDRNIGGVLEAAMKGTQRIFSPSVTLVCDTSLWGNTGPINGHRYSISIEHALRFGLNSNVDRTSVTLDGRVYLPVGRHSQLALRTMWRGSFGEDRLWYLLGGSWRLRGYDVWDLYGPMMALANVELRFPLIRYMVLGFPGPMALVGLQGTMFFDIGGVWDDFESFRGVSSDGGTHLQDLRAAYGFGLRKNIFGYMVARFDIAWPTDLQTTGKHHIHFSLGADF